MRAEATGHDAHRDRYVHIHLAGSTEPPREEVRMSVLIRDWPDTARPTHASMTCGCPDVSSQGVSDLGDRAELLVCPGRGVPMGVLMSTPEAKVSRLILYDEVF